MDLPGKLLRVAALGGALGLGVAGCGPVEYLNQVTRRAASAQAAAEKADAEKLAPYEYWTGKEYLHKARELAGHARFQLAIEYGRKAEEAAIKAREISLDKRVRRPSTGPAAKPAGPDTLAPPADDGTRSE